MNDVYHADLDKLNRNLEQYTTVEINNPYVKILESHRKLIREAIELFNDGLHIGLGWVARAERLLGDDE